MEIKVTRSYKKDTYTIGNLYINGVWFCNTIEDKDRGLKQTMSIDEIKSKKVYAQTAIPSGRYQITVDVVSPKFSQKSFYKTTCDGKVPRVLNVPGYDGILLHVADGANGAKLVEGCLGIGYNKVKGGVLNGKEVFTAFYNILKHANDNGEKIYITIE